MEVTMTAKKTRKQTSALEVTNEERYHLINDVAYFRSLHHQGTAKLPEDQGECWCEAESEIDGVLKQHHAKP
jgi:hypothetical protein